MIAVNGDPDAAFENIRRTWEALRAGGVEPIAFTCELDSGFASTDATKRKTILRLNRLIKSYCIENGITLVDMRALFSDPTSAAGLSATTYHNADNLHPNIYGARALGQAVATALTGKVNPISLLPDSRLVDASGEFFSNPLMYGSGGGVWQCSGTPPDGVNALKWAGAGTWTASAEARTTEADGDAMGYNAILSTSAISADDAIEFGMASVHEAVAAAGATSLRGVCHIKVTGASKISSLTVGIVMVVDSVEHLVTGMEHWLLNAGAPDIDIKIETPVAVIPAGTVTEIKLVVRAAGFVGSGACSLKMGRAQIYKVA